MQKLAAAVLSVSTVVFISSIVYRTTLSPADLPNNIAPVTAVESTRRHLPTADQHVTTYQSRKHPTCGPSSPTRTPTTNASRPWTRSPRRASSGPKLGSPEHHDTAPRGVPVDHSTHVRDHGGRQLLDEFDAIAEARCRSPVKPVEHVPVNQPAPIRKLRLMARRTPSSPSRPPYRCRLGPLRPRQNLWR